MRRSAAPSLRFSSGFQAPTTCNVPKTCPSISSTTAATVSSLHSSNVNTLSDDFPRSTESVLSLLCSRKGNGTTEQFGSSDNGGLTEEKSSTVVSSTAKSSSSTKNRIYSVVWGKQSTKKHKTWEGDGTLELGENSAILKDEEGKILGRASQVKTAELQEGSRLKVGSKEVELIDLISGEVPKSSLKRSATEEDDQPKKANWKKPKKQLLPKRQFTFSKPSNDKGDAFILPAPSHNHQWIFNENKLTVTPVVVDNFLSQVLRPHQKIGVLFLYECVLGMRNEEFCGAILADEMGLGKTLQTIALIWTLHRQGPYGGKPVARRILIVCPSSLVLNWQKEFHHWLGKHRLQTYVVDQKNKVAEFARLSHIPVLLISYEMFLRNFDQISKIKFDLLICDEGHRLKNTAIRTSVLLNQLEIKARILLTGTPIQNDLQEFFALVSFVNPGILGTAAEFRKTFEDPIVASRQPDCNPKTRLLGEGRAVELNAKTSKFILRRTQGIINQYLPTKTEAVIFIKATAVQETLFRSALNWWEERDRTPGTNDGSVHLGIITLLKKICNHPALIRTSDSPASVDDNLVDFDECFSQNSLPLELTTLYNTLSRGAVTVGDSGKLKVVKNLLEKISLLKERVVLVSYFTQSLDMMAALCDDLSLPYCRLDGSTPSSKRIEIVDQFNAAYSKYIVFLLSARAGGVGLNLTGASRLILYDSDWNPANDAQAMSRIWREGQKHSVFIYRLLTCGSIEEKIFQRQLSKAGLSGAVVDPKNCSSIKFSNSELKDIFTYSGSKGSVTHESLGCQCSGRGSVPLPEECPDTMEIGNKENQVEGNQLEQRDCQLHLDSSQSSSLNSEGAELRINHLFHWQHHSPPFDADVLKPMAIETASEELVFMFVASAAADPQSTAQRASCNVGYCLDLHDESAR